MKWINSSELYNENYPDDQQFDFQNWNLINDDEKSLAFVTNVIENDFNKWRWIAGSKNGEANSLIKAKLDASKSLRRKQ